MSNSINDKHVYDKIYNFPHVQGTLILLCIKRIFIIDDRKAFFFHTKKIEYNI